MTTRWIVLAVLGVLCTGCTLGGTVASPSSTPSSPAPAESPSPTASARFQRITATPAAGSTAVPSEVMDAVRAALREAGVRPEGLRVRRAQAVTWSDGSLGCAAPGQSYTQALVPGYEVIVDVDGATYDVHTGRGMGLVCTRPHGTLRNANA